MDDLRDRQEEEEERVNDDIVIDGEGNAVNTTEGEERPSAGGDGEGGRSGGGGGEGEEGEGPEVVGQSPPLSPHLPITTHLSTSPHQEDGAGDEGPSWASVLNTLGPDHPLLKKFQEAKKQHLLEEKSQLQLRLRQLRQQTEDLKQSNVQLGAQLFDVQQAVTRAQVNLDKAKTERRKVKQNRQAAEETLQQAREEERSVLDALNHSRKHEASLQREVASLGSRVAVLKSARAQSDGDVTTLTRALHNTAWDRANLEKDKMTQDAFVERLMAALEREKVTLQALRESTAEERELTVSLQARARLQQEELQQLECEGMGVMRAWEANVLVLQQRSQEHSHSSTYLQELLGQQAGLRAEVYNTRKAVKEEQLKHEQHSTRLLSQETYVLKQREHLAAVREETQQMAERHEALAGVVERLEGQVQNLKKEASEETKIIERLYGRIRKETERHRKLEDQALDKIGEHTAASKAAQNLRRQIKKTRNTCRNLEDELVNCERCAADAALRASDGRVAVLGHTASRDTIKRLVEQLDADVSRFERDLRRGQEKISANQCAVDRLNKEMAKVLEIAGGSEAPPAEREERRLRTLLQDREKERTALEEEALTVQRHLLEAREARDLLAHKTTRLRQEVDVLQGRLVRLEGVVEQERGNHREAERRRERLHKAVATLDARLHQEKVSREAMSRESDALETLLLAKLKHLETELERKEREVEQMVEKKDKMEGTLLAATQERGEWERNLVEVKDARDSLRQEMGTEGDLHAMKTEINRMQARWRGLEATQKELSNQLEQSVTVESALKTRTLAMSQKLRRDPNSAKATRLMQEDILKRKIGKTKRRLADIQAAIETAHQERCQLEEECQRKERVYAGDVHLLQKAATHLEEKLVKKQEEQLKLQEHRARLRHLTALRDGRYRALAAPGEDAQQSLKARLVTRAHAYTGVITQLEASYPQMEVKLRNIKMLLQSFLESSS